MKQPGLLKRAKSSMLMELLSLRPRLQVSWEKQEIVEGASGLTSHRALVPLPPRRSLCNNLTYKFKRIFSLLNSLNLLLQMRMLEQLLSKKQIQACQFY